MVEGRSRSWGSVEEGEGVGRSIAVLAVRGLDERRWGFA